MLAAINAARASGRYCGTSYYPAAAPLAWNAKLTTAAAAHSHDMADKNYFSHTSLDGRTFIDRIVATSYVYSTLGENIAAGSTSVGDVMSQWLASPGHCGNIMNAAFADFGGACAANSGSTYGTYWTNDFGS